MKKIVRPPFVRFLIGIVLIAVPYFGILTIGQTLISNGSLALWENRVLRSALFIFLGILVVVLYKIYFKFIEQKPFYEFSFVSATTDVTKGIIFTLIITAIVLLIFYFNSNIHTTVGAGIGFLPLAIAIAFMSSFAEEILFRGLLFRLTEEKLGSYIAIGISSVLFGIAHYVNPNATVISALAIGLESGLILSAVYILTRKLWLNIAIHFTWNLIGGILGFHYMNNKGEVGVFNSKLVGSKILTGGELGIEFSILIVLIGIIFGLTLILIARKRGLIVKPAWVDHKTKGHTLRTQL